MKDNVFMTILPRRSKSGNPSSPQFTRRHYIWLTNAAREMLKDPGSFLDRTTSGSDTVDELVAKSAVETAIDKFLDLLVADNPRFNKQQFLNNIFNPMKEEPND